MAPFPPGGYGSGQIRRYYPGQQNTQPATPPQYTGPQRYIPPQIANSAPYGGSAAYASGIPQSYQPTRQVYFPAATLYSQYFGGMNRIAGGASESVPIPNQQIYVPNAIIDAPIYGGAAAIAGGGIQNIAPEVTQRSGSAIPGAVSKVATAVNWLGDLASGAGDFIADNTPIDEAISKVGDVAGSAYELVPESVKDTGGKILDVGGEAVSTAFEYGTLALSYPQEQLKEFTGEYIIKYFDFNCENGYFSDQTCANYRDYVDDPNNGWGSRGRRMWEYAMSKMPVQARFAIDLLYDPLIVVGAAGKIGSGISNASKAFRVAKLADVGGDASKMSKAGRMAYEGARLGTVSGKALSTPKYIEDFVGKGVWKTIELPLITTPKFIASKTPGVRALVKTASSGKKSIQTAKASVLSQDSERVAKLVETGMPLPSRPITQSEQVILDEISRDAGLYSAKMPWKRQGQKWENTPQTWTNWLYQRDTDAYFDIYRRVRPEMDSRRIMQRLNSKNPVDQSLARAEFRSLMQRELINEGLWDEVPFEYFEFGRIEQGARFAKDRAKIVGAQAQANVPTRKANYEIRANIDRLLSSGDNIRFNVRGNPSGWTDLEWSASHLVDQRIIRFKMPSRTTLDAAINSANGRIWNRIAGKTYSGFALSSNQYRYMLSRVPIDPDMRVIAKKFEAPKGVTGGPASKESKQARFISNQEVASLTPDQKAKLADLIYSDQVNAYQTWQRIDALRRQYSANPVSRQNVEHPITDPTGYAAQKGIIDEVAAENLDTLVSPVSWNSSRGEYVAVRVDESTYNNRAFNAVTDWSANASARVQISDLLANRTRLLPDGNTIVFSAGSANNVITIMPETARYFVPITNTKAFTSAGMTDAQVARKIKSLIDSNADIMSSRYGGGVRISISKTATGKTSVNIGVLVPRQETAIELGRMLQVETVFDIAGRQVLDTGANPKKFNRLRGGVKAYDDIVDNQISQRKTAFETWWDAFEEQKRLILEEKANAQRAGNVVAQTLSDGDLVQARRFADLALERALVGVEKRVDRSIVARAAIAVDQKVWMPFASFVRATAMFNIVFGPAGFLGDLVGSAYMILMRDGLAAAVGMFNPKELRAWYRVVRDIDDKAVRELVENSPANQARKKFGARIGVDLVTQQTRADIDIIKGRSSNALPIRRITGENRVLRAFGGVIQNEHIAMMRRSVDLLARETTFMTNFSRSIRAEFIDFQQEVIDVLKKTNKDVAGISEDLRTKFREGGFTPEEVYELTGNQQLARSWRRRVNKSESIGNKAVGETQFTFENTNLDEVLRRFTFFHYWQTRAMLFYAKHTLSNWYLAHAWVKYFSWAEDKAKEDGLPPYMVGFFRVLGSPYGVYTASSPVALLTVYDTFNEIHVMSGGDDQSWQNMLAGFFMVNPLVDAATQVVAGYDLDGRPSVPNLLGARSLTNAINTAYNAAAAVGALEFIGIDNKKLITENIETRTTERIMRFIGGDRREPVQTMNVAQDDVKAIGVELLLEHFGPTDDLSDPNWAGYSAYQEMEEAITENRTGNEWADAAAQEYWSGQLAGVGVKMLIKTSGTVTGPKQSRVNAAREGDREASGQMEDINDVSREEDDLNRQIGEYNAIGGWEMKYIAQGYNQIVSAEVPDNSLFIIGGVMISGSQLKAMDEQDRRALAWIYVGSYGKTEDLLDYWEARQAYVDGNPLVQKYFEYKDQADKPEFMGSKDAFRRALLETNNKNFEAGYRYREAIYKENYPDESQEQIDERMSRWVLSHEAFLFWSGIPTTNNVVMPEGPQPEPVLIHVEPQDTRYVETRSEWAKRWSSLASAYYDHKRKIEMADRRLEAMGIASPDWNTITPQQQAEYQRILGPDYPAPPPLWSIYSRWASWRDAQGLPSEWEDFATAYSTSTDYDVEQAPVASPTGNPYPAASNQFPAVPAQLPGIQ